jgi:hypothetical protein
MRLVTRISGEGLIGACTWGADAVNRQTVRHLLDETIPKTVAALPAAGQGRRVLPALFTRSGATADAPAVLQEHGGILVDLPTLYHDLGEDAG